MKKNWAVIINSTGSEVIKIIFMLDSTEHEK